MSELLHETDPALLQAVTDEVATAALTPELPGGTRGAASAWDTWQKTIRPQLLATCSEDLRLAVVSSVFEHLLAHAKEGGSFRYLIYDRLGFGPQAYVPLYLAGGMVLSNEFTLPPEGEAMTRVPRGSKQVSD